MHSVFQYFVACGFLLLIGIASAGFVWALAGLPRHGGGRHLESRFALAGLIGIALIFASVALDVPAIAILGVLLVGWIALPFFAIPVWIIWQLGMFCTKKCLKNKSKTCD